MYIKEIQEQHIGFTCVFHFNVHFNWSSHPNSPQRYCKRRITMINRQYSQVSTPNIILYVLHRMVHVLILASTYGGQAVSSPFKVA